MNRSCSDGWSTASAVPKEACIYPALPAEVKKKIPSGAKALSHSYDSKCTPEGVLHPISRDGDFCRPGGAGVNFSPYPALARWAKLFRPLRGSSLRDPSGPSNAKRGLKYAFNMFACVCLLGCLAAAQNITGTVTNATTGKPSAGDEVTLLSLSQGMQEVASTKSDASGRFSFAAPADANAPHMVRATHDGVNYFPQGGPLMPGSTTAALTVYDSARKLDGLNQTVEVDRYQTDSKQLQGITLYAMRNQSQPPRTLADDKRTFEIVLPDGAEVESAQAKGPGGQPIAVELSPTSQKNHYSFNYPLRPGETQFQVSYHMPYNREASISPKPLGEIQHFVVMTPKGMTFTPKNPQQFQSMPDETGAAIMVVTNVKPGQDLSFRIAGTGIFQAEGQQSAQGAQGGEAGGGAMGGSQGANDNRPGGGLGAPVDAPDPLHEYRAVVLGAFALVLVMGGAYVISKSNVVPVPALSPRASDKGGAPVQPGDFAGAEEPAAPRDRNALLLEAMKEELFQLEIDRQQGKITPEEYAKAKAALDETIKRALARSKLS
jgi:hypothetical protein